MWTDVSEVLTACNIRLMMEGVSTFETSVSFYETARLNIPEDGHLYLHNIFVYERCVVQEMGPRNIIPRGQYIIGKVRAKNGFFSDMAI
jgi:hypothetical protein